MDLVVYRAAEAIDVSARSMRAALAAGLREMQQAGVSIAEGLAVLDVPVGRGG